MAESDVSDSTREGQASVPRGHVFMPADPNAIRLESTRTARFAQFLRAAVVVKTNTVVEVNRYPGPFTRKRHQVLARAVLAPKPRHAALEHAAHQDLLPALAAAGFARAVMLNFTPTGEMREENLVREAKGTAPAQWGAIEEQVRQSIVGRIRRRNAWTLQVAREHARLVPFIGIDPRMGEDGMLAELATCVKAAIALKTSVTENEVGASKPVLPPEPERRPRDRARAPRSNRSGSRASATPW
jgi:hypothetical protein